MSELVEPLERIARHLFSIAVGIGAITGTLMFWVGSTLKREVRRDDT